MSYRYVTTDHVVDLLLASAGDVALPQADDERRQIVCTALRELGYADWARAIAERGAAPTVRTDDEALDDLCAAFRARLHPEGIPPCGSR